MCPLQIFGFLWLFVRLISSFWFWWNVLSPNRNWPWIWASWLLSGIKSFTALCHSIFTAATGSGSPGWHCFSGPFALYLSLILSVQKVCISEVIFFFLCALLSMAACLRTPVKRWAYQAVCHISNSVPLPFPELCCFVPGSEACVCKAQRPSLSLLGRSICPGSSYIVLDGENGWIAKWKHGRKPHDLCTCFRLEGFMGQEPAFESACLELGLGVGKLLICLNRLDGYCVAAICRISHTVTLFYYHL